LRHILLLALAAVLGTSGAANAETVREVLQEFGMLGTWATDCSRPPAPDNILTIYAPLPNGNVRRTYYSAPGKISNEYELNRVVRISGDQISYHQQGPSDRIDVVLEKKGNRYHVLSSQDQNGKIFVQDGKFTANTPSPGQDSTWQTKCHE
jgi:hypothetical protein